MVFKKQTMKDGALALVSAGVLAMGTIAMPTAAMAIDASAGEQTGSGSTDVTVQFKAATGEYGGNTDPNNKDGDDANDWGDNIAFSVPSSINFVADAQGRLTGPNVELQNHSSFAIHASSFDVDAQGEWTIIGNGSDATKENSADFQFGPAAAMLDAYDYLDKGSVADIDGSEKAAAFNMAAGNGTVSMQTGGDIFKVEADIGASKSRIATIQTFVGQGAADAS